MTGDDLIAYGTWSVITVVFFIVVGLVYTKSRRKKDEPSSY